MSEKLEKEDLLELLRKIMDKAMEKRNEYKEPHPLFYVVVKGHEVSFINENILVALGLQRDQQADVIREMSAALGVDSILTIGESWITTQDAKRFEALTATASGLGTNIMIYREIMNDDKYGDEVLLEGIEGRLANLSGNEMLN